MGEQRKRERGYLHLGKRVAGGALLGLVLACLLVLTVPAAKAEGNQVHDLQISVTLDDQGNANVMERYTVTLVEGTEMYLVKDHLEEMGLANIAVSDETGTAYLQEGVWDTQKSREEKTQRFGLVDTDGGYEICWGIDYGDHVYTVRYTMTNMVQRYSDYDGFNVRFFNDQFSMPPAQAQVTIEKAGTSLTAEDTEVWAFGFLGNIAVQDGKVVATASQALTSSNYINIMVRFDHGLFTPTSTRDTSFSTLEKEALKGSDQGIGNKLKSLLPVIVVGGILLFFVLPVLFVRSNIARKRKKRQRGLDPKKMKNVPYYAKVPCEGDLFAANEVLHSLDVYHQDQQLIGACFLHWIQEGLLQVETVEVTSGILHRKKTMTAMHFVGDSAQLQGQEAVLYDLLRSIAGDDLREDQFSTWSKSNWRYITNWAGKSRAQGVQRLLEMGAMTEVRKGFSTQYCYTKKGVQMARDTLGFKEYLHDFTTVQEKQAINAVDMKEYLEFATLFGIADQVDHQFQNLYPKFYVQEDVRGMARYDAMLAIWRASTLADVAMEGCSSSSDDGGSASTSESGGGGYSGGGSGGGVR